MKISKLFHWLYALVMFLPIFAIGVTCGYAMFNKNAFESYSGNNSIENTYIRENNQFEVNNRYYFSSGNSINYTGLGEMGSQYKITFTNVDDLVTTAPSSYDFSNLSSMSFYNYNNNGLSMYFYDNLGNQITSFSSNTYTVQFSFDYINNNLKPSMLTNTDFFYRIDNLQGHYIDNVFYYSIDKVKESPMFSWAYNSFLVTPFAYIVNLFSMPTNSVIVLLLSYWLTISICWLVFDLVMYVPLLVHRWLDKGVIE